MDLSIIIASFNTRDFLRDCLDSIFASEGVGSFEIFVVDNNSSDGSPELVRELFPAVELLTNSANVGFAKANNRALKLSSGRYILLLNPDTRLETTTLAEVVGVMDERPEVGMTGLKLVRQDGSMDLACRRGFPTPTNAVAKFARLDKIFPNSRIAGDYNQTHRDPDSDYEVDAIVGAFMFFRREVLEQVGLLDERFFMYGEDLDWCWRIRKSEWKVLYLGSKEILHVKGASTSQNQRLMNGHFHRSMYMFHKKHLVSRYPFFVNWVVQAGIGTRWAAKALFLRLRGESEPASHSTSKPRT